MRVDDTRSTDVQRANSAKSLDADETVARRGYVRSAETTDQAARTSSASLLSLSLQMGDDSETRIDSLRAAIASGTYELDPTAVSRAMLRPGRALD